MSAVASHRKKYLTVAVLAAIGVQAPAAYSAGAGTVGSEFRANSSITGAQQVPAVAADSNGNFAVTWESVGHVGGNNYDVFVRLFDSAASAQTGDLWVNTSSAPNNGVTNAAQHFPDVAMDSSGDFVVVWHGPESGSEPDAVFGQRYNAAGAPQGANFRVNTITSGPQQNAAVAMDSSGNFVVAYESVFDFQSSDCSASAPDIIGIAAQRFDSTGSALGSEIGYVNDYCTGAQSSPDIAMDSSGDFVIVWQSAGQDGSGTGIYGKRYNAGGVAQGGEFPINTTTASTQSNPSVAMDSSGNFLVAWQSQGQDGSNYGVYSRLFNATASPLTGEVLVNTSTTNSQVNPSVSADGNGNFLVAWNDIYEVVNGGPDSNGSDGVDGDLSGVFAQAINSSGSLLGDQVQLNSYTTNYQRYPAVAGDADGDYVGVWTSLGQDADTEEVYGRRARVTELTAYTKDDFDADGNSDLLWRNSSDGRNVMWFMDGTSRVGSGDTVQLNDAAWSLQGMSDFNGDFAADILWRNTSNGRNVIWFMNGTEQLSAQDTLTVATGAGWTIAGTGDFNADKKADLFWRNTSSGRNVIWLMNGATRTSAGDTITLSDASWYLAGLGDFGGNGTTDMLWRNSTNGRNVIWFMSGTSRTGSGDTLTLNDANWTLVGLGDFDGNGTADMLWRNTSNGRNVIWFMNGTARTSGQDTIGVATGAGWSVAAIADYNNDQKSDLLWHNSSSGRNVVWLMNGATRIGSGDTVPLSDANWSLNSRHIFGWPW